MSLVQDDFGNRMKSYEAASTARKASGNLPVMARLDGRSFSKFCQNLNKPYDERLSNIMDQTLISLVKEFHVQLGYTQSDEITLYWYLPDEHSQLPFGGRFQKLESVLAGYASAVFNRLVAEHLPEKAKHIACFDCRAWEVPSTIEAANTFLWRQQDAKKNAISMAAQRYFSPSQLLGKNGLDKIEMMKSSGVSFEDYPARFKHGVYAMRQSYLQHLTPEELERIKPQHRPTEPVMRSKVALVDMQIDAGYFLPKEEV